MLLFLTHSTTAGRCITRGALALALACLAATSAAANPAPPPDPTADPVMLTAGFLSAHPDLRFRLRALAARGAVRR